MPATNSLLDELIGLHAPGTAVLVSSPARAVAWARVSTAEQEERGLSIPEQLREIRQYAESQGIEIVMEFREAVSAYQRRAKRTEFDRMLAWVRAERVSMILVHDFSRFSRDSAGAKTQVRELREAGIRVVLLNDPEIDPDTVAGVHMEAITFAKNEAYSREVAFHTRKGCRANVQARDPETGWCYKNGGQPPWGYRSLRLERGQDKRGRPILKSVWTLDDAIIAGRPAHEWARHCLVELAANGASLAELRDFCNRAGIPARRKTYWGLSTWNAILQPSVILQFCGYGVWNARTKEGRERPSSEWVIVPKAQPALITEDEARALVAARRRATAAASIPSNRGRSLTSEYLLSGGLFRCARCNANMVGFRTSSGQYYICGSQPYRKGMGCGPGVYVPRRDVESEVCKGLDELLNSCGDPDGFTRQVNSELRRVWQEDGGHADSATAGTEIATTEAKIANIRRAVEDGFADASWANARLRELIAQREALTVRRGVMAPPQLDAKTVMAYRRQTDKLMQSGHPAERKRFMRAWVQEITLEPQTLEVKISYRLPEAVMKGVVAGAGFEPATFGL
ncbi:MAG TPA: recombinase family protein [Terriglobia bacterium]|nr:recombinase family protein [Terriglobia bacterium]